MFGGLRLWYVRWGGVFGCWVGGLGFGWDWCWGGSGVYKGCRGCGSGGVGCGVVVGIWKVVGDVGGYGGDGDGWRVGWGVK